MARPKPRETPGKTARSPKGAPRSKRGASHTSTDVIMAWFREYVERNHVKIGDSLPSENDIVRETGTSRTSVREALNRMRALGVVETRRKRGMRLLRSPTLIDLARLLDNEYVPPDLVGHLGGFRSVMEMGLVTEIFRRATDRDVVRLREIYEQMVANTNVPEIWNELDRKFHELMIQITGNKLAIWFSHLLQPFFGTIKPHSTMSEVTREKHRRIVVALENRDLIGFHHAMREHHLGKLAYDNYDETGSAKPLPSDEKSLV